MMDQAIKLDRLESRLTTHIDSEEILLRDILATLARVSEKLVEIREDLAVHGERSKSQHDRIKRSESIIMYGGGIFMTVFSGLVVALLTGAI